MHLWADTASLASPAMPRNLEMVSRNLCMLCEYGSVSIVVLDVVWPRSTTLLCTFGGAWQAPTASDGEDPSLVDPLPPLVFLS